jgi:hypothetical protein
MIGNYILWAYILYCSRIAERLPSADRAIRETGFLRKILDRSLPICKTGFLGGAPIPKKPGFLGKYSIAACPI